MAQTTVRRVILGVACLLLIGWAVTESRADSVSSTYEKALGQASADTEQFPYTYQGRLQLANRLAKKGEYDLAIEVYGRLLEDFPDNVDLTLMRGRAHAWSENFSRAQEDLKTVVEKNPEYADAWQMLGNVYRWSDQIDSATYAYTNWIKLQPDRPEPYLHRGRLYRNEGQYQPAKKDFRTARKKGAKPEDIPVIGAYYTSRVNADSVWVSRVGYRRTLLSEGANWTRYNVSVEKTMESASLTLEAFRARHFNTWNTGLVLDTYLDLDNERYLNLRYQVSTEHDFLPRHDMLIEGYQPFGFGWEGSLGVRRMNFDNNDVDIVKLGLARYWGDWYGRYVIRDITNNTSNGLFNSLILRRYLNGSENFVELRGGQGEEVVEVSRSNPAGTIDTESFGARCQFYLDQTNGFDLSVNYVGPDGQAIRRSATIQYLRRW
jgi:YaiO family outer membrane protein